MKERPILFSAPMVRAILAGTKTQTRRVVKPQPTPATRFNTNAPYEPGDWIWPYRGSTAQRVTNLPGGPEGWSRHCPYGQPGDRLWVREAFAPCPVGRTRAVVYRADGDATVSGGMLWRPSIHMPRWASRILLKVTDVRVQRLLDITEGDAVAEGIPANAGDRPIRAMQEALRHIDAPIELAPSALTPLECFEGLWDSINAKRGFGWSTNPWVWAVSFQRVAP